MVEYHIQQKCGIKCLRNGDYMKKLFEQIVKFGIVGFFVFVIVYVGSVKTDKNKNSDNYFLFGIRYF